MLPSRWFAVAMVVLALSAIFPASASADSLRPVVVGSAPVVTYFAPAPVVVSRPVVTFAAPVSVPVASPVTVSTFRYGLLPRRTITTVSYGAPVTFAPAPVIVPVRPTFFGPTIIYP